MGKQQHQRKLCQLRGLELEAPDEDPAVGVIDRRHKETQNQQYHHSGEQDPRQLSPYVVIHTGKGEHRQKPQCRPRQLPHNVVVAVALAVVPLRIAGGKHHNQPEYQKQHHHYQKGEVHAGILIFGEQAAEEALLRFFLHTLCFFRQGSLASFPFFLNKFR